MMFNEMARQWLHSNGYVMDENLYYIRETSKFNFPVTMKLIKKSSIFEIYWAETKPVEVKVKKNIPTVDLSSIPATFKTDNLKNFEEEFKKEKKTKNAIKMH